MRDIEAPWVGKAPVEYRGYNDYGYDDDYEDEYNEDNDEYFFTDYADEEFTEVGERGKS